MDLQLAAHISRCCGICLTMLEFHGRPIGHGTASRIHVNDVTEVNMMDMVDMIDMIDTIKTHQTKSKNRMI